MAVKLESLEFEIQHNSSKASEGIDALTASLGRLKTASRGFSALNRTTTQLRNLNNELSKFNTSSLAKIAQAMESLSRLGNVRIPASFAKSISTISGATTVLTDDGVARFERLAQALQQIGSVGNIRIPNMRTMQNIENTQSSTRPLTSEMGQTSQEMQEVSERARSLITDMRGLIAVSEGVSTAIQAISTAIGVVAAAITVIIRAIRFFISLLKRLWGFLNKVLTPLREFGKAMVSTVMSGLGQAFITPFKKMAESVGNTLKGMKQLWNSLKRIAMYRLIRSAIAALTQGMKAGIENLYQYSKLMGTDFAKSMDKIATSALYLKNSLAAMVSPIINAIAPAIDMLTDKLVGLFNKINQVFSAMFGKATYTAAKKIEAEYAKIKSHLIGIDELNIIEDDQPPVNEMFEELPIDTEVKTFADKLREAFEEGDWESLGRTIGDKFNEIIEKIDWEKIGKTIGYYLNGAIQTFYYILDETDFESLGNHIADLLNQIIAGVDWKYVGGLLVKQFTSLWDLAIGFFEQLDYAELGHAITDLLVGIFSELKDWFEEKDWKQLAEVFNNALADLFKNLDFRQIGQTIGDFLKELFHDFKEWISHVDWVQVGKDLFDAIKNFFDGFDFGGVLKEFFRLLGSAAKAVKDLLKPVWDGIKEWWNEHIKADSFKATLKNLGNYLVKFVDEYIMTPFFEAFLGEGAGNGKKIDPSKTLMENMEKFLRDGDTVDVGDMLTSVLTDSDLSLIDKFKTIGQMMLYGVLYGIHEMIKDNWLLSFFVEPFLALICKLFGIHSPAETMKPIGENIILGVFEGIKEFLADIGRIKDWIVENIFTPIGTALKELYGKIKDVAKTIWDWITEGFEDIKETIKEIAGTIWEWIVEAYEDIKETIKEIAGKIWDWIVEAFENIKDTIKEIAGKIWDWIVEAYEDIKETIKEIAGVIWDWIVEAYENIKDTIKEIAGVIWNWIVEAYEDIKDTIKEIAGVIWEWIVEAYENIKDTIKGIAETIWDWVTEGLRDITDKIKDIASIIWSWITEGFHKIIDKVKSLGKTVIGWFKNGLTGKKNDDAGESLGENLVSGIEDGAINGISQFDDTSRKIVDSIYDSMSNVGENRKISMVEEVAGNIIQGLIE